MQLREYQEKLLEDVRRAYRGGSTSPLVVAPTGSGKSALMGYMLDRTRKKTLVLVHRGELRDQISKAISVPHSLITPGSKPSDALIQIGTIQTVVKRLDKLPNFEWLISDEAHLSVSKTWQKIIKHYPNALQLGFSASPVRLDGRGLKENFTSIIKGPSIKDLTELGYLSVIKTFSAKPQTGKLKSRMGDYVMSEAAEMYDKRLITGHAVEQYKKHADGKTAIVFCCNVQHAKNTAEQFREAGYVCESVDGKMSARARLDIVDRYRRREIQILTSCELLTMGFDVPHIECGIMLRPTKSLALFLQMVGRITRPSEGKAYAVLLDHVANVFEHGLPTEHREWALDGKKKKSGGGQPIRVCKKCFFTCSAHARKCPECGEEFLTQTIGVEVVDGELREITEEEIMERKKTRDIFQWRSVAVHRNLRPGWVSYRIEEKYGTEASKSWWRKYGKRADGFFRANGHWPERNAVST